MKQPFRLPCLCGSTRDPVPVVERGRRKGRFIKVRCPECRLTTASAT